MTNTIPNVPRELLDLSYDAIHALMGMGISGYTAERCKELRTLLQAPESAGVEGLEVVQAVAWLNTATKEATTHPVVVMDWDDEKEPVESLMPISQHEAIIDGLRGENERIRLNIAEYNEAIACYQSERDQQAQRIGELEGLLREVHDTYRAAIHWEDLRGTMKRIDSAMSAGKEGE